MNEIELEKLFKKISVKFNVGDYNTFKSKMLTKEDRKKFYDKISVKFNVGNYEQFEERLSTPQQSNTGGKIKPARGNPLSSQDFAGIDFKYNYPGDRNYIYGIKGTDWYAKNKDNGRVFNITKDGFTSSVDKLNVQFPNAFKEVVQPTTPEKPTQDLTRVGTYVPPVKPMDSTNPEIKTPDKNPTTDEYDDLRDGATDEYDDLTNI